MTQTNKQSGPACRAGQAFRERNATTARRFASETPCQAGQELVDLMPPDFFKALCEPNRLKILAELARSCRPCTVSEISRWCPVDISVVSRHLGVLKRAGVVHAERRGKEVLYSVCADTVVNTLRRLADAIEGCCLTAPDSISCEDKS
jgi:ArsR family transcriptional regulator, arsenate/arsenite/antimonite-responsive transcriptional repressor